MSTARVNGQSPQHAEYARIFETFNAWKEKKFQEGMYADAKKCSPDTVSQTGYTGPGIGVPEELNISFSDLNHDNIIDALITFTVDQCDESNTAKSIQRQVLVLSNGNSYDVDEKYFEKITSSLKKGWITVEHASFGRIHGSFHDFKNSNDRIASTSRNFSVVYPKEKLEFDK
jgi:hypothetical protein